MNWTRLRNYIKMLKKTIKDPKCDGMIKERFQKQLKNAVSKKELFKNPKLNNIQVLNPNEMVGIPLEVFINAQKNRIKNL